MPEYEYGVDPHSAELTLPAERFAAAYVANGGVVAAACREAGYRAASSGYRLMKSVKVLERIRELKKDEGRRLMLEESAVREELKRVGFAKLRDVVTYDGEGQPEVKPLKKMNRYGQASLQALKMTKEKRRVGKDEIETTTLEVKQHAKVPALIALDRILGENAARVQGEGNSVVQSDLDASRLSVDERVVFRKLLSKLRGENETVLPEDDSEDEGRSEAE